MQVVFPHRQGHQESSSLGWDGEEILLILKLLHNLSTIQYHEFKVQDNVDP